MEVQQVLHMNKGEGETSYAKNSYIQRKIISAATSVVEEAVIDILFKEFLAGSIEIADLGCSTGPNTLMLISEVIEIIYARSREMGLRIPELRISLNDLPANDFNGIFISLPEFHGRLKEEKDSVLNGNCFVSGVPGSFYGRLFPSRSQHFVHSSSSLHWLSQVPPALQTEARRVINKGKIYISRTSPQGVLEAYLSQFQKDFSLFLRSRAAEIVPGGRMVLSFMGRSSADPTTHESGYQWELLAQALASMVSEGFVEEEMIDAFNAPYYAPSPEEVKIEIEKEGSFTVNHLESFEIDWDGGVSGQNDATENPPEELSRGERVAKIVRAVVESMLASHFGGRIMDELFKRYVTLVEDYYSTSRPYYINLVISLTRKIA